MTKLGRCSNWCSRPDLVRAEAQRRRGLVQRPQRKMIGGEAALSSNGTVRQIDEVGGRLRRQTFSAISAVPAREQISTPLRLCASARNLMTAGATAPPSREIFRCPPRPVLCQRRGMNRSLETNRRGAVPAQRRRNRAQGDRSGANATVFAPRRQNRRRKATETGVFALDPVRIVNFAANRGLR
jgi:hypothetical protein